MSQPNILYIHSHDTGRYVQPYGHTVPTPNIQALADEGVTFRQAFCANPTCSPSRAALLSGTYPHQNGMFGLAHRGWYMNDYNEHIIHTLKTAGYKTALSGIQHIIKDKKTEEIGYDEILIPPGIPGSPDVTAAEWIYKQQNSDQPFFLSVGFGETHRNFPKDNFSVKPEHVQPPAPLPDTTDVREDMAAFTTYAGVLDRKMGTVFDALRESGQWENTLIICTTDHGIAFPLMKCNLTDHGIGVMLMMRGPGGFKGGVATDALVSQLDIFPTVCDLCGIEKPERLQGKSLLPLVNGKTDAVRDEIHAEVNYHAAYEPQRCVRTDRYKYIRRFDNRDAPVLPNVDDSLSKNVLMEAGWPTRQQEMLYDTILDSDEACNLVNDAEYADVLADMRKRLQRWQRATDDPILNGHIAPSAETVVNDINASSPNSELATCLEHPQW